MVGYVMSLLFNMLSRFVTAFFPRSKLLSESGEKLYIYIHTYIHTYIYMYLLHQVLLVAHEIVDLHFGMQDLVS